MRAPRQAAPSMQQMLLAGDGCGHHAAVDTEVAVEVLREELHGRLARTDRPGDLLVGQPVIEQAQNLVLALAAGDGLGIDLAVLVNLDEVVDMFDIGTRIAGHGLGREPNVLKGAPGIGSWPVGRFAGEDQGLGEGSGKGRMRAVAGIDSQPDAIASARPKLFHRLVEQGGFAEAGRCPDRHHLPLQAVVEPFEQEAAFNGSGQAAGRPSAHRDLGRWFAIQARSLHGDVPPSEWAFRPGCHQISAGRRGPQQGMGACTCRAGGLENAGRRRTRRRPGDDQQPEGGGRR
jgi:hypothetical protein